MHFTNYYSKMNEKPAFIFREEITTDVDTHKNVS